MTEDRPWFEEAFRAGYLAVYPHRDLEAARGEIGGLLERGLSGRTLDLGCGFGRHSLALLEAGLPVVGLDLSRELLAQACRLPGSAVLARRLVCGDFRALPFCERAFDTVVMLFSSFGYLDDRGNAGVAAEVARILRPGGRALFDLMNPARIRRTLVPHSVTEREGFVLEETRSLAEEGRRVRKHVILRHAAGPTDEWHEDVRMYAPGEMGELLAGAGLELRRVEGGFDGRAFEADSERQIVWAERT